MGYMSSREVNGRLLLPEHAKLSDAEISLDQVHSEGLRQWNMDMDIEYQYETFNGLPVYYGGDMYDSEDTEEFVPNALDGMEYMTYTQRLPDGGDNRSVNAVNMAPMCRTVSRVARCEPDESSDTSRTDTAELEELDSGDCDLGTDVWEYIDCPVLIAGSRVDNSLYISSQAISNYRDVAYLGDFADEDFIDTDFDSDMGSGAEFGWNTRNDACAWESWSASENFPPDSAKALPSVKDAVDYRDDSKCPASVVPLRNLPDVIGLVGRRDNARESRILQGRDPVVSGCLFRTAGGSTRIFMMLRLWTWVICRSLMYSTNHVYLHRPNAFGFWQARFYLCYETLKHVSNFSELA